ncbi:MAG: EamA family transporter [Bacillota bacterium]|nr:EamA family transporter [Bacillota bacterium]
MSSAALSLVVVASSIHAGWNLLTKRAANRLVFLWLVLGAGLILYAPVALYLAFAAPPPARGLLYVLASGLIHSGYYYALSRMYEYEFSLTYPTARGSSPVLVALVSLLILREPLTGGGLAGIALVVAGIAALQLRISDGGKLRWPIMDALRGPAGRIALATGCVIACYSLVDKIGVSIVHPVLYIWSSHAVAFAGYYAVRMRHAMPAIRTEARRAGWAVWAAGLGQNMAYILVLFAMRLAPVAYVVPAREMSTLIGTILGVTLLREPFPAVKLGGAGLIMAGVVLIALRG